MARGQRDRLMNSLPGSFIRLSTDQFAERDRIEATREIFGRAIVKCGFEPLPDIPFHMDMVLRALPDFGLSSGTCSAMNCLVTSQLIGSDDVVLTVALSGGGVYYGRGREAQIGGGTAFVAHSTDEGRFCIQSNSEFINFRFPFNRIAPLITDFDAAMVRPIPKNTEALRLLVHYAGVLRDEDTLATPEVRSLVSTQLHDLAALAIGATRDAAAVAAGRGVRAARLRAIKADIVENLTNRQLSIDSVAARHGVTPRYVSRLFESDATTFSEFALVQRLNRARRMLVDPRFSDRTVSSVAFEAGFGDISYFNRAFRRLYGATPSDVRAEAQSEEQS
jgi:AraC-like DNA-binding protein